MTLADARKPRAASGRVCRSSRSVAVPASALSRPGMYLEGVELNGFKSFTAREYVSFCPHFTVITGPNGSGKSNVLDAVCFALTEDEKNLRVKSWTELVSTEQSVDKATVVLTFVEHGAVGTEKTRLSASVKKSDGATREFKLNGVRKTVREVRLWLKNYGLDIEGHSNILQQNTVVSLADKTPSELAAMVMSASGGAVFDSMIETANSNITKAEHEKQLTETKIMQFQRDVGDDGEKMKMIDRYDKMVAEMSVKKRALAVAELASLLQQERASERQIQDLQSQRKEAQSSLQSDRSCTREQSHEHRREELKDAERRHANHVKALRANQELQAEEAEEERIIEAQLAEEQAEREETMRTLSDLIASKKLIAARQLEVYDEMGRNDAELQRLTNILRTPEDAENSASRIEALRLSLATQKEEHIRCTSNRNRAQKLLQQHSAKLARCRAAHAKQVQEVEKLRTATRTGIQLGEQEINQKLAVIDIALETIHHQLQGANITQNSQGQSNRPLPLAKQLCFNANAEKYLDALSEIAGSKLQALVMRDVDAAAEFLRTHRSSSTVVLWPLDRLQSLLSTAEEDFIASAVEDCQGEAILPSSVLSFTGPLVSTSGVPFKRVFGGWAISTTSRATKYLLEKNIRTCELNGTKHVPGIVSGGFLGGHQRQNVIRTEFEIQKQQVASEALAERAAALNAEREALKLRLQTTTDLSTALETQSEFQAQQSACETDIAACEAEIGEAERSERLVRQQLAMTNAELNNRLTQDTTTVQLGLQDAKAKLMQQNEDLAAELTGLSSDLQQAGADENQLTERLQMMSGDNDAISQAPASAEHQGQPKRTEAQLTLHRDVVEHRQKRRELQETEKDLQTMVEQSANICRELQAIINEEQTKAADACQQQQDVQLQLQNIDSKLRCEHDRLKAIATNQSKLVKSDQVQEDLYRDAREQACSGAHDPVGIAELRVEVKVLEQKHTALQTTLSETSGNSAGIDLSGLAAKQNQLSEFLHKRETIDKAISKLREEIATSENKKNAANQKAFDAISATFAEYFATLAPSKEARLRIGPPDSSASHEMLVDDTNQELSGSDMSSSSKLATAINQVHFVVRTRRTIAVSDSVHAPASAPMNCDADNDSDVDEDHTQCVAGLGTNVVWKTSTNELSGGQRTLLGLAFVLAIAKYQPSPVYILDEVDAALDEGNQARVASLVAQVLGHEQRCQTIAISHHADFQRGAARVTEICKKHGVGSCVANSFDRVPS